MIDRLDWDSNFFNKRVGVANVTTPDIFTKEDLYGFDLVYLISENDVDASFLHEFPQCNFVDDKITFSKKVSCLVEVDTQIYSLKQDETISQDLIDIAIQSGVYSRFKVDSNIPESKFKELYTLWITNSINRTIAKEVLVYKIGDVIAGLITLGQKNGNADIGLIAVDEKYRGNQIGQKLLYAAEYWAKKILGVNVIQVVTQGANKPACSFYEKNGFIVHTQQKIFHWWNPETHKNFISVKSKI